MPDISSQPSDRTDSLAGRLTFEQQKNRIVGREADGNPRLLIIADGNQFNMRVSKPGMDAITGDLDTDFIFNSDNNLFKIVGTGFLTVPSVTTTADGTNTFSGFNTASVAHGLGFTPLVMAWLETSTNQFTLMPYSEVVSAAAPQGGLQSNIFRVTTSNTNVTLFVYRVTYSPGIGAGTTPGGQRVKYYLLQETAV